MENFVTFVSIIAYYINNNNYLEIIFISFWQIIESFTRKIITKQVINIINQYELETILEYFVFNNITNNNTYIKAIFGII